MAYILNIETATNVCSVTVSDGNNILFERENTEGPSHATLLGVFVEEAVKAMQGQNINLDAVAVSCGPGSYTGLRIGVSEAKGICYGLKIPLIAIETPLIMVNKVLETCEVGDEMLLCPMIDARRMEVYAGIYDCRMNVVRDIKADIVDETTYSEYLKQSKVLFFGNGSEKCQDMIKDHNASFVHDIYPSALFMSSLSQKAHDEARFVDVAYFEPFYLKDFVATTPKKNIF